MAMLSQLLSSKPKTNVINLFLAHPLRSFSFTELRANSGATAKILKQTLRELDKIDFINTTAKNRIRYYQMNKHFTLYPELVTLLRKVKQVPADNLAKAASKLPNVKFVALTGVFVGKPRLETDILIVGKVSGKRLRSFLELAEKFGEQEISYTVFSVQEFEYRKVMNDRFVKNILENNPSIVLDKIKTRKAVTRLIYK